MSPRPAPPLPYPPPPSPTPSFPPPTLSFCPGYALTPLKTPPAGRLGGRNGEGEGDWGGDRIEVFQGGAGPPVVPFWPALLFQKTREKKNLFHLVGMMKAGQNAYFMNLALHGRDKKIK